MGKTSSWVIAILLVGSFAAMALGRTEGRSDLEFGGFAILIALLAWFAVYRKQRAARDPVFAAKMEQIDASPGVREGLRGRGIFLPVLVPALIIALPLIWLLRQLQPATPMLEGFSAGDLERIAIAVSVVIALMGYGMFRLLRRGDSGNG